MLMTFDEAVSLAGFELLPAGGQQHGGFDSVCVDSRRALSGSLFVALSGEKLDGHAFVKDAFKAGAAAALVERSKLAKFNLAEAADGSSAAMLVTDNTMSALQALAAAYLERFPKMIRVGITGSSGKTTTKELAAAMAGLERNVIFNEGNLNSDIGLPLSVFKVREEHEIGIFEMGMNRKGEIAELAAVLKPQIALITNTGTAHIGLIGGEREIALEKKAVFSRFTGKEQAVLPEKSAFLELLTKDVNGRVSYFGTNSSKKFGGAKSMGLSGSTIVWGGKPVNFPLPGEYNVMNALAAAAIAEAAGVSDDAIRGGLESAKPLFARGEIVKGDITIVRDCYNANPDSMEKAITLCDETVCGGRRVYVIGSMLELGGSSEAAHEALGERLARSKADIVFLFGEETKAAYSKLRNTKVTFYSTDIEELKLKVKDHAKKGDIVLLKGSRCCGLERIVL
ncbi:MAG: UDP-N-acetylmuramoyl-tripeptide--D-alanyl-D-alanine ligase [Spirochaetaceae bacterium]|jgi:UDP-N-acetylmuramoyl-tripeptide--D-alanyl-D-alanine ligase|nr:UDP-N-acetylmuramoyl-tripeptide--D-alanyl-D-alanine ligase [Spirochaetaceae bacterium]